MTLLSLVIPVYRVQGYLRECLDSIFDQTFTDIEVIAIDDCSPDSSGEILAEYAARDPRLRVITQKTNQGQGPARNLGVAEATGEYVWFVDSDDWLAPESLRSIANRLRATEADVLIVDHAKVSWDGKFRPSWIGRRFHLAPRVFALHEWPETIEILHVPWNKIVRRSLLNKVGFQFRSGWYEDVPYTYELLAAAERISLLDKVCVYYRQRRQGSATKTLSDGHFAIFPNWAQVFETLDDSWPGAAELRPLLFRRMMWHFLMVRGNEERIPRHLRGKFFQEMYDHYHRYLPPGGYPVPEGMEGVKHRLVAKGRHRTFHSMRVAYRLYQKVRKNARTVAKAAKDLVYESYYRAQMLLPMDQKLAVYAAYWYRGMSCNPAAVYEMGRELAPDVRGVWVVRKDKAETMPRGVDYVVAGTLKYYRTLARARWMINNVNWPDFVRKRSGAVHVMTHHGTPLKVMGVDQRTYMGGVEDPDFEAQMARADRWDFSVTANTFTTQMWERAYPCDYQTLETGYPRNDRLVKATPDEVAQLRRKLGIAPGEKVVLYAPTHREHRPGYAPPFDVDEFVEAMGPNTRLLVRSHYFRDRQGGAFAAGGRERVQDMSAYPSVEELYLVSDVLVTDYSSVMFDYGVLDRPIVIYAPDWLQYKLVRGVYFDVTEEPPGAVALTFSDLLDVFRSGAYESDAAGKARADFRRRFCHLDDGHASERVVRRVLLGESPS
ncbi:bifunctional glycosyltransferase family 2 protein/CDP-glycerol:glycerophosphate glycerophosphotransferase [Micromonospora sp. CPCC 205371]|nr:bifunctional glycosyltransferase family 2 protein/CDP-glycerol:glycerophosphate glycerophosphotransferase [Micromonospora sp. CPCC 205371]